MEIIIRRAEISDSAIIAKAFAMAIGEESSKEYCGDKYLDVLEDVVRTDGSQYCYTNAMVAQINGIPAGAIIGYDGARLEELRAKTLSIIYKDRISPADFPDETQAGEFYIDSIGVLPEYRGLGLGREMVVQMCNYAFENGFRKIGLIVDKENPDAEKLYSAIGFHKVGIKAFFGHQMWHMQADSEGKMSEREKMLSGLNYSAVDDELLKELNEVKMVIHRYNSIPPADLKQRTSLLKALLGYTGDNDFIINQPFYCDYGRQISIGKRFFANFNLTILDEAYVSIGDDCFIGPNVSLYTACHSTDPVERNSRREWAEPIKIGDNVWIGGSVTILPGVNIGNNVTIGAGSVVTRDIPDNVIAVGNPCRVIKNI